MMSVHDVAEKLKVSDQYVRTILRNNELEAEMVGKQWIIHSGALDCYIQKNNITIEPEDHPRKSKTLPQIVALSFFSGAMGLDLGMEQEGISPILVCENDKETRKTIHANKPEIALIGDIRNYSVDTIIQYANIPKGQTIDIVFGGPPCQAFSTAGKQRGFEDERGNVFLAFIDVATKLHPKYIVIENVRGLLSAQYPLEDKGEPIKGGALLTIVKRLRDAGYAVSFELYNAANFGSPQVRERVVMICKKGDSTVGFLSPTHSEHGEYGLPTWITLGEAIRDLSVEHHHVEFPEKRLQYYRMLKEGQNWRDLPNDIQQVAMGKSYSLPGGKTGFYRRLSFDRPSPTLVTHPAMPATDLCHPKENRPLSIEEYKRIQGFPDDWVFCGSILDVYRQIGNAVPIPLGRAVGRVIMADMENQYLPQYEAFPYSRYLNTNHFSFIQKIESEIAS